ncbi:DUF1800 domain-containing protein [uncultured Lacinutrix sp.]|uniref:DUF1800 domain-containing protein n=1 Tax=uncultured Lacinutrix sp. TaxID=574032 RepID=UPI002616DF5F|nr:DUF1800 domain-containing protein [uncultured Lacinutrix sp.]
MQTSTSCNTSSLSVYVPSAANPWNAEKANHLYRRLHFGASKTEIDAALTQTPETVIDAIIDNALAMQPTPDPSWANMSYQDYEDAGLDPDEQIQNNHDEIRLDAFNRFLNDGLFARLTLFWSNHYVTELSEYYCSSQLFEYYKTLQTYALGNFEDFTRAIGTTGAMLVYLNGLDNTANSPNENYARELYELFTLGVNNGYTQTDIVETAKALTGYNGWNGYCAPIDFNTNTFNNTNKTIFGQTGNWGYDDVINILFQEKAPLIANFICKKLYKYFVSPNVNDTIVSQMASVFVVDFNISNVLRTLFKSEHFFNTLSLGTQIKSPYDLTINYLKITGFSITDEFKSSLMYLSGVAGQNLFNPVDVAGWQGNHDWINSSTLTGRWEIMQYMIWQTWNEDPEALRTFALETAGDISDPYIITKAIIDRFVPKELHTLTDYDIATDIFKYNISDGYYEDNIWSLYWQEAPYQVVLLLLHIIQIPEFQIK